MEIFWNILGKIAIVFSLLGISLTQIVNKSYRFVKSRVDSQQQLRIQIEVKHKRRRRTWYWVITGFVVVYFIFFFYLYVFSEILNLLMVNETLVGDAAFTVAIVCQNTPHFLFALLIGYVFFRRILK